MHHWFSSPGRSIVTAVIVSSAFGAIVALIAWLEPEPKPEPVRYLPDGELSDFMAAVFAAELMTLQEESLYAIEDMEGEIYRLLYVPSFQGSVSVRIDVADDGSATMRIAEGVFDTDYLTPGKMKDASQRVLSELEFAAFKETFDEMDICTAPPDETLGLDGYNFVFEWRSGDQYCLVERWAPDPGPFLSAGELMLKMAGVR